MMRNEYINKLTDREVQELEDLENKVDLPRVVENLEEKLDSFIEQFGYHY